ncbi:TonB-dependent receptor [Ancylomarina sp. 16SWW S1-10-2]|nr:TonB-dependent receptor [Ancylomarina sp. 16SWW S1-10-2]
MTIFALLFCGFGAQAQELTVQGTVLSEEDGLGVPGVSVIIIGTTIGTVTDIDGNYTIPNVPADVTLRFSFIGMVTQEIQVAGKNTINVSLKSASIGLNEVVAIGYGFQKKKLVTGATDQVKGEDIEKMNSTSALGALQSQSSGVNIVKASGQPGSSFKVSIRGVGTTGSSSPLYVVDGITVDNIDNLAPSDIQSIDVLKDAASAAIYGARAANGVVIVSTKKGREGKAHISYDAYYGIQKIGKKIHPLMNRDYMDIMDQSAASAGSSYDWATILPNYDEVMANPNGGTDWFDALINDNATTQSHAVNITGGTDQSIYSIGVSYLDQEGIIGEPVSPSYNRYNVRINTEHTIIKSEDFDILKVGENFNFSRSTRNTMKTEGKWNSIRTSMTMHPFMPIYNDNGDYQTADIFENFSDASNAQAVLYYDNKNNESITNKIISNLYVTFQPIKDLIIRSSFGVDGTASEYRSYIPEYYITSKVFNVDDAVTQQLSTGYKSIFENSASYKFNIDKNNFDVLIGSSYEKSGMGQKMSTKNTGSNFDDFDHAYIDNANVVVSGNTTISGSPYDESLLSSYFGRVNYDYNETYMATLVMRADGSSNFAPGKRWGYFPSVSTGWVMSNESFMEDSFDWLDFLKIRASWGENGNQNIDPFQYLSTIAFDAAYPMGTDHLTYTQGAYPNILANPDVTWETSVQTDIGFDARLLASRLVVTFDWYNKETKDWLVQAPISGSIGTGAPYVNGGDIRNRGYEIGLTWRDQINDFHYNASFNISHNKNEVLRIANSEGIIHGGTDIVYNTAPEMYRAEEGYAIGYFWGYKTDGIFQDQAQVDAYVNSSGSKIQPDAKPGDLIYKNMNDDDIIDSKDKVMIGDPNPDYNLSLAFSCDYKNFDFSFNASGVMGNQIFRMYREWGVKPTANYIKEDIKGYWTPENHSNSVPRIVAEGKTDANISDRYVEDGDYLRMNNITLGYDFAKLLNKSPFSKARFYASVQNAFTITKYKGLDPEVGSGDNWAGGIDLGLYPTPRTFMIGISLNY